LARCSIDLGKMEVDLMCQCADVPMSRFEKFKFLFI
jgi:hypothetical protein